MLGTQISEFPKIEPSYKQFSKKKLKDVDVMSKTKYDHTSSRSKPEVSPSPNLSESKKKKNMKQYFGNHMISED